MNNETAPTVAVITSPGKALLADNLLDLTAKAWEQGLNLSGEWLRKVTPSETPGFVWVEGENEEKLYSIDGNLEK